MVFNWVLAMMGFVEGQTVGEQNGLKDKVSDCLVNMVVMSFSRPCQI